jgi:hypothetical protein
MIVTMKKADFYIFGSTSELVTTLVTRERPWFEERVHRFILIQRSELVPDAYRGFDVALEQISANDAARFESDLSALVARHQSDRFQHVLPTYGLFNLSDPPVPRFRFNRDGLQINLNARLQILEAFRPHRARTRLHFLGSLFASFPYLGDYALSMFMLNQVVCDEAQRGLDIRIYHLGGMRTRFWDHSKIAEGHPFVYEEIPARALVSAMDSPRTGATTFYPSLTARLACFLGRRGVRVLG